MLGVVAIHVGAQYLTNPTPNLHLVTILEIVSRFSVPIFFFISAFGLFYKIDLNAPFSYRNFLRRRFKAVLLPYIFWSVLYILHDNYFYGTGIPAPAYAVQILFFGLAKYQLYFLVLLVWFYLLMPIWIKILRGITREKFLALFIAQIAFNYFSSYNTELTSFIAFLPEDSLLKLFLMWRLNYLVLHYVFIFLLGGFFGVHSQEFFKWLSARKISFCRIFLLADLRKRLRRTFRDKYGTSTFAARIFIYNRRVNLFIYVVPMLQIRTTNTSVVGLFRRKFVLGVFTSPIGDNVFKQVAS